jgi:predicted GNAT family acetyltransferase
MSPLLLDNPIWAALTTAHEPLALSSGLARRYPRDISPLAALREPTEQAFNDLSNLVDREEMVGLFTSSAVTIPAGWKSVMERWIEQMVYEGPTVEPTTSFSVLNENDVSDMLALTAATEPGPFRRRTIEMGLYLGIRNEAGRLVSMVGQRLQLDGFTEISAVCTDPEHRGRGYAGALLSSQIGHIQAAGNAPFLHVKTENGARLLYEKLGFRVCRSIRLTVVART